MGLDELFNELCRTRTLKDHPSWPAFCERSMPAYISFYYTNQAGDEAYWDHVRIIKLNLEKMLLTLEGSHGDPLYFDLFKITGCKNSKTGERVQDMWVELIQMWQDIYEPTDEA